MKNKEYTRKNTDKNIKSSSEQTKPSFLKHIKNANYCANSGGVGDTITVVCDGVEYSGSNTASSKISSDARSSSVSGSTTKAGVSSDDILNGVNEFGYDGAGHICGRGGDSEISEVGDNGGTGEVGGRDGDADINEIGGNGGTGEVGGRSGGTGINKVGGDADINEVRANENYGSHNGEGGMSMSGEEKTREAESCNKPDGAGKNGAYGGSGYYSDRKKCASKASEKPDSVGRTQEKVDMKVRSRAEVNKLYGGTDKDGENSDPPSITLRGGFITDGDVFGTGTDSGERFDVTRNSSNAEKCTQTGAKNTLGNSDFTSYGDFGHGGGRSGGRSGGRDGDSEINEIGGNGGTGEVSGRSGGTGIDEVGGDVEINEDNGRGGDSEINKVSAETARVDKTGNRIVEGRGAGNIGANDRGYGWRTSVDFATPSEANDESEDTEGEPSTQPENRKRDKYSDKTVVTGNGERKIKTIVIAGQIEGHSQLPQGQKATRYEELIPELVEIEESDEIGGLLLILNTVGGDVEAGLALSELIAGMKKPTASLVLGGGHSIGVPLAVSAKRSFIVPSATMTLHPVRITGMILGAPQTYVYLNKMQERIIDFTCSHCNMTAARFNELMLGRDEMSTDLGSVLDGHQAVSEGLIDALGTLNDAISFLKDAIS